MPRCTTTPRPSLMALSVAAALMALAGVTRAAPVTFGNITLDATYALGGGPTVDAITDPNRSLVSAANGGDFYLFKTVGANNVFFHTYGFTGTSAYFGARASGGGHFDAFTRSSFSGSFIAAVADPVFNFFVDFGEVGLTGTGTGTADLKLEVRVNGVAVERDHTTITRTGSTSTCVSDDLGTLGSYIECSSPTSGEESDNGGQFSAILSGVNPGDSFTLDYDIIATVSGNLTDGLQEVLVCDGGYGGYGGEPSFAEGQENCEVFRQGGGIARSGDPFNLAGPNGQPGIPGTLDVIGARLVPEPGSLVLAGLALAGAAALRRRRTDDASSSASG